MTGFSWFLYGPGTFCQNFPCAGTPPLKPCNNDYNYNDGNDKDKNDNNNE